MLFLLHSMDSNNYKKYVTCDSQLTQPGSALAINPMVVQALQAAQWSANVGHMPYTAPIDAVPTLSEVPIPSYVRQTNVAAAAPALTGTEAVREAQGGVDPHVDVVYGASGPAISLYPHYAPPYTPYGYQQLQVPRVRALPQWPPHFDTNGGSYVFQAATGCFLEPSTEFYYDPKSKLYYNGRDGSYYRFDASFHPPFVRFVPPPPPSPVTQQGVDVTVPTQYDVISQNNNPLSSKAPAVVENTSSSSVHAGKVKMGLVGGGVKLGGGAVGFGFGLPANKKVKVDIAKWGALQQEVDDGDEEGKIPAVTVIKAPQVGTKRSLEESGLTALPTASAIPTEPTTAKPVTTSNATLLSPPPPPPLPQRVTSTIATAVTVTAVVPPPPVMPNNVPVCILCQRQFPSFEMLLRHERESKLHADNLKKSMAL